MLRQQINDAIKHAMKNADKLELSTLRLINAAIKDRDIANRGLGKPAIDDSQVMEILARMIKQREESAKIYAEAGRDELSAHEKSEIAIISAFLPQQLNDDEIGGAIVKAIIEVQASGLKDMGKVMAWLKANYAGQMNFAKASAMLKDKL